MSENIVTSTVRVNQGDIIVKSYTVQSGSKVLVNSFAIRFADGKIETLDELYEKRILL